MSRFLSLVVVLFALSAATSARAQVHWDASLEAGAMKRFRASGSTPSEHQPEFGPTAQFAAHLALAPLIQVGGYLENDISGVRKEGWRDFTAGGLHIKGFVPLFPKNWRGWVFVGVGYGDRYQHAFSGSPSQNSGFFEIPFGIGVSYKFWKPFCLFTELSGRAQFANSANASYDSDKADDRAAMSLAVGIMVEL